jgi:hypothetical protein
MAIPRKDVKVMVNKRVHDAIMLAQALGSKGIARDLQESRGIGRNAS